MISGLGLLVLVFIAVVGAILLARLLGDRPHVVVRFGLGRAELERGQLPGGMLGELRDVVSRAPDAEGVLRLRDVGKQLDVDIQGLEGLEQQIRNVVMMHRDRIRRPS